MSTQPDFEAITSRQRTTWSTGDFNVIARCNMPVSEALCTALDIPAGAKVLDIACGSGNTALVAARRHCDVVGVDYVTSLLERARRRADAEGSEVKFQEADAQALPFPDGSFDYVVSTFGVMFAPDQEKAASELLRVCRSGGQIGLSNWMPEAFGGDFFRTVTKHVPPPQGLKPPNRWGTELGLTELLGPGTSSIRSERRAVIQYYRSLGHIQSVFRNYFGPTRRAYELADDAGKKALEADLAEVFLKYNQAKDGTIAMRAEYLQVLAVRA